MSVAGAIDVPLEVFGGLVSQMAPSDLPIGASPACQDVSFLPGKVFSRPGLNPAYAAIAGNPTINYLKTYITSNELLRTLVLDSLGGLWKEDVSAAQGVLASLTSAILPGSYAKSTTLFGREYIAFSNGALGTDLPRQFDDTHLDRVSQSGPGASPTATDDTVAGNIPAGVHQLSVMFITRQGYLTAPAPPSKWTAAGSKRAVVSSIPTGPANVVARMLCFTLAGDANFYFLSGGVPQIANSNMLIGDNTTTTATVDFSDAVLAAGTSADNQFNLVYLGEIAGCLNYNSRLITWGAVNKVNNLLNLGFDGGFSSSVPLGWTLAGGAGGNGIAASSVFGTGLNDAYSITGDGINATRGLISQGAFQDFNNVAIIQPNAAYNVSFRAARGAAAFTAGMLKIQLFSASAGIIGTFSVTASTLTTAFLKYSGALITAQATIPSDLVLRVFMDGTPTNGSTAMIDEIEIYPSNQAFSQSTLQASIAGQAETFNGLTGIMQVEPFDGQAVRTAFKQRGNLYFVKERSLYFTKDDGVNEPSLWKIEIVSAKVGSPSINGVGAGEDWVIIAARDGPYIFWGTEPIKVGQEIQPDWDTINWAAGQTIWTVVDIQAKRILFGVPTGSATAPNKVLTLDYSALSSGPEIAEYMSIHSSTYTGKNIVIDKSRKHAPWNIQANSGALVERNDGTAKAFIGAGSGAGGPLANSGKVYFLDPTKYDDDGQAINAYYTTFFFLEHILEQQFQLGSHRKLFIYLTAYVQGSGVLNLTAYPDTLSAPQAIASITLSSPAARDTEVTLNVTGTRVAFRVGTNAAGAWFSLEKFVPTMKRHDWADVRGTTN